MVLKSTSTRGNGGTKTDRSDVHAGIESSNELNETREFVNYSATSN